MLELQLLDKPNLAKAASHARNYEQVRQQVAVQRQQLVSTPTPAGAIRQSSRPTGQSPDSASASPKYRWCGAIPSHARSDCPARHETRAIPSHARSDCPARHETYMACGKDGHYSKVCLSKPRLQSTPARQSTSALRSGTAHSVTKPLEEYPSFFMGSIGAESTTDDGPWMRKVRIGATPVLFKVDTGADISVITAATYSTLCPKPMLVSPAAELKGPDGSILSLAGRFQVTSRAVTGNLFKHEIHVLSGAGANLLSCQASYRMGFVGPGIANVSAPTSLTKTEPLGCMAGPPVTIRLKPDAQLYHCPVARRVPFPLLQKVKAELNKMVESGIITTVTESTEWCFPMVAVKKKNGDIRVCVDLKRFNMSVQRETFVLPTGDETLAKLSGATVFTTLDTTKGFWQVPLAEDSQYLTTIITPFGRFMFRRLPFGISSAPEIIQRKLLAVLDGIPSVVVFMDDILIYGKTIQAHDAALQRVQAALSAVHVTLNPAKSQLRERSIKFLGHVISTNGVRPDPDRISALIDLGLFTYLPKYIPNIADVSAPLRALLRSNTASPGSGTPSSRLPSTDSSL